MINAWVSFLWELKGIHRKILLRRSNMPKQVPQVEVIWSFIDNLSSKLFQGSWLFYWANLSNTTEIIFRSGSGVLGWVDGLAVE